MRTAVYGHELIELLGLRSFRHINGLRSADGISTEGEPIVEHLRGHLGETQHTNWSLLIQGG